MAAAMTGTHVSMHDQGLGSGQHAVQNVPGSERLVSALAGGGLAAAGIMRGSWLGLGMTVLGGSLIYRGVTGHCSLYQALGINRAGFDNPALGVRAQHGVKYETSIWVARPADELYNFWRKLENLPRIMQHLESVTQGVDGRSHWVALGPLGKQVEWDAEIINERPSELIAWRSLPGSQIDTAGSVHFVPGAAGRGTVVQVSVKYDPPGGKAGATLASLLGAGIEQRIEEDLRQFKQKMEAGPMPLTAATSGPSGFGG